MSFDKEEWRSAAGFPSYEVSNFGRVRRSKPGHGATVGRVVKSFLGRSGYPTVRIDGKTVSVHRVVCTTFIGPPPSPDHEVNHKDRDRLNAHVDNLEWVTRSENIRHAFATAVMPCGEQRSDHKLTWDAVRQIRQSTETLRALAHRFGVCHKTIWRIKRGEKWPERGNTIVKELR